MLFRASVSVVFIAGFITTASAHHGRDFLMVQDAAVPLPFSGIAYGNFEMTDSGPDREWSFAPGTMFGLGRGIAVGGEFHFSDEGEGWEFASVAPQVQVRLTPQEWRFPVRMAVLAGYEFAQPGDEEGSHDHGPVICGPEYGPDAPPCDEVITEPHTHSHGAGGIHQHGRDGFFGRIILESDLTDNDKLVVNFIHVSPDDGTAAWGYAAGWRHAFSHETAVGIEAIGDFRSGGYHELAAAAYFSPSHAFSFKLGLSAGLTDNSPDFGVRAGLVWRY